LTIKIGFLTQERPLCALGHMVTQSRKACYRAKSVRVRVCSEHPVATLNSW